MHRPFRSTIALVMFFISVAPAIAQSPAASSARLRYSFAKGQKLYYKLEESTNDVEENLVERSSAESQDTKENGIVLEVVNVAANGDADINFKFDYLRIVKTIATGVSMVIDTRRPIKETNPGLFEVGPQAQPAIDMIETIHRLLKNVFIDSSMRFTVNNQGHIMKVTGFDILWDKYRDEAGKIITDPAKRAQLDALIEGLFGEKAINNVLSHSFFVPLPSEAVAKSQQWSETFQLEVGSIAFPIKKTYRLDSDPSAPLLLFSVTMTFGEPPATEEVVLKISQNQVSGTLTVDPKSGVIKDWRYVGRLQFEGYTPASAAQKMLIRVSSNVKGSISTTIIP